MAWCHCQITRPDQLKKIEELGLHVYAQPIFLDYDIHMVTDRVGEELASTSYAFRTLMDAGVWVSSGTDCPVELPPGAGLHPVCRDPQYSEGRRGPLPAGGGLHRAAGH